MTDAQANSAANSTLVKHVLLLITGTVIGWLNDSALVGLLCASLIALGWHVYNIVKLQQWLGEKPAAPIPYGTGMWSTIYARISHFRERSSVHQRRSKQLADAHSAFVHTLPNAAFELNQQFEVLSANKQAIELIDSSRDQLSGHISNSLRQPAFVKYLESGKFADGVVLQAAHNPEQTLQCVISDHGVDGWLLQLIDISVQIRALQIREDFVANASHELRTPVTVIKGYLESFVGDESLQPDMQQPIQAMSEQVNRMEAIIADLLTLNVIESAGPAPGENVVNVPELPRSIHKDALTSRLCPKTLELNLESNACIMDEEVEIRSVFTNLISNAMRFTPREGRVALTWSDHPDGVTFKVDDNGIGIHEDDILRVTERFYRTDPGRNRHQFGTGLGLAIVKHALARHDTELSVKSTLGEGSQFSCVFPNERLARH